MLLYLQTSFSFVSQNETQLNIDICQFCFYLVIFFLKSFEMTLYLACIKPNNRVCHVTGLSPLWIKFCVQINFSLSRFFFFFNIYLKCYVLLMNYLCVRILIPEVVIWHDIKASPRMPTSYIGVLRFLASLFQLSVLQMGIL